MSRYPQMRQSAAYDRSLLVGAPHLTNAERQAGYNIDALEQGSYPAAIAPSRPIYETSAPAAVDPFQDPAHQPEYLTSPTPPKQAWWKTKRGRILIGLAVIILIGILAGIAAGAATAKSRRNTTLLAPTSDGANVLPSSTSSISSIASSTSTPRPLPPALSTSQTTVSPTTATVPFGGPSVTPTPRPRPTNIAGTTNMLPPGGALPTATAPLPGEGEDGDDGDDGDDGEEIPTVCILFPFLSSCQSFLKDS